MCLYAKVPGLYLGIVFGVSHCSVVGYGPCLVKSSYNIYRELLFSSDAECYLYRKGLDYLHRTETANEGGSNTPGLILSDKVQMLAV